MFGEEGMGWGRLRRKLDPDGEYGLHPGIGWIMRVAPARIPMRTRIRRRRRSPRTPPSRGDDEGRGRPDNPGLHGRDRAAEAKAKHENGGNGNGRGGRP